MLPIITFIGWHNSGKTTLATRVVTHLTKAGFRVAVIKSSKERGIVFDRPGSDTAKHRQAGANSVLFVAPDQMVLMGENSHLSLVELADRYSPDVDIVIGEGFKNAANVAKIEVLRNSEQMLRSQVAGVIAVATDLDIQGENIFKLDQSAAIASFVEERFLKRDKTFSPHPGPLPREREKTNETKYPVNVTTSSESAFVSPSPWGEGQGEGETVPLAETLGRFTATDIISPENLPSFSCSTMDGFAVKASDTNDCNELKPAILTLAGEITMGSSAQHSLKNRQAASILTGGKLPAKADAVVMIEDTRSLDENTIEVCKAVAPGTNVIRAGENFSKGDVVFTKGKQLRARDLGVLAGLGITEVPVFRKPVVGILSTGDELVEPNKKPGPGQIRDTNSTTLAALVLEAGGIPLPLGIVGDDFDILLQTCRNAIAKPVDILLLSGGSSKGKRDFTLSVFKKLDKTVQVQGSAILAQRDNCTLIGLPGPTASAIEVFHHIVQPLLRKLSGFTELHHPLSETEQ